MRRFGGLLAGAATLLLATAAHGQAPARNPEVSAALQAMGGPGGFDRTLAELERLGRAGAAGAIPLAGGLRAVRASDMPRACRLWEEAAAHLVEAAHLTAECYQKGLGGRRDVARAVGLFELAAAGGHAKSKCALGNLYIAGEGVAADRARGVGLCREGAEAGDADAQTDLGNYYLQGVGVAKDVAEARRWYEKAAAQRHRNAAFVLGQIYWNGDGVPKDNARAAEYWRLAHSAGRPEAAILLGDEAFVRLTRSPSPEAADRAVLQEAIQWYERAELVPQTRAKAQERLKMLRQLQAALPPSR